MKSWSRTALRCQSHVSHPWRCAYQKSPVAYFPTAKPLQRRGPPSTSHLFGSTRPRRRILRRRQFKTPHTIAPSGGITCVLPLSTGGTLKQNRGKTGCPILAVLQVVSAPACFSECDTRCFVGWLFVWAPDGT